MAFLDSALEASPPGLPPPEWDVQQGQPVDTPQDSPPAWDSAPQTPVQTSAQPDEPPPWDSDPPPAWDSTAPLSSSKLGTAARGVAHGMGAGLLSGPGAAAGFELGTEAAPLAGPLAPVVPFVGGAIGAIGGGAIGQSAEDWLFDKLGLKKGTGEMSDAQEQADAAAHPDIQFAGNLLPSALSFGGGGGAASRALGAVGMGGMEAGQEYVQNGTVSPGKIAIAAGAGAVMGGPREWAGKVAGTVTDPVTRAFRAGRPDTAAPDASADKATADAANDTTITAGDQALEQGPPPKDADGTGNPDTAPMQQRTAAIPSDPTRAYGKTDTVPTAMNTDDIHPDLAAVLKGDQNETPPPQNQNLAGGPSPGPEAVPPPAPIHTGLATTPAEGANEAAQNGQIKNASAIPASMDPVEASQLQRQGAAKTHQLAAGKGEDYGEHNATVETAIAQAEKRPVVTTPMPSIANSSKDMNGPVYIHPGVPPEYQPSLKIHETVEAALEAQGMEYAPAHQIATKAEMDAVRQAGIDPKAYSDWFSTHGPEIEKTKVDPKSLPQDLASNPYDDIGHYSQARDVPADDAAPGQGTQEPGKPSKALSTALDHLRAAGRDDILEGMAKLPLARQEEMAREYLANKASKTGKATGSVARQGLPQARPTVGDVQARSPGDQARKQAALDAVKSAFAKFGTDDKANLIPTTTNDKGALLDRLKQADDHARAQFGGKNPVDRTEGYKPRVLPPEWQWLRSAQKLLAKKNPSQADFTKFATNENLLRGGGAKDVQNTARIEGDISHGNSEAGEHATQDAASDMRTSPRTEYEPVPPTKPGDTYVSQSNALREWMNALPDDDWERLNEQYPMGLDHEVLEGNNPGELLTQLQNDLVNSRHAGPLVRGNKISTPVTGNDRFAETEAGAKANEGRSLKGTPEWEELTRQYGGATKGNDALREKQGTLSSGVPLQGAWDDIRKMARGLGAHLMTGTAQNNSIMDWATGKYHDYFDPKATPADREYGSALDDRLHRLGQMHVRDDVMLRANAKLAGKFKGSEWQDAYRAAEKQDYSTLSAPLRTAMEERFDPLMGKLKEQYEAYREERPDLNLPEWTDGYVPRMRKGTGLDPTAPDENDPILGVRRHLSGDAAPLKERQFFTLDNNGQRTVFSPDETGITTYKNGVGKHYDAPSLSTQSNDPNYVGKSFTAGKITATVDHAYANEINTHVDPKNLQYIESPMLTASNAYKAIKTAADNWKMVRSIADDPHFKEFSTRDPEVAKERGYVPIELPDKAFRGMSAAAPIARVLNDYSSPGFKFDDTSIVRQANRALTKMIFTTPIPHALNETQLWATQRGFDWLPANGNYKRLMQTSMRAMQSVNNQDYVQDQLAASGASPMLGGVLTHNNMQQIAEKMGLEISRDAPKFDPLFKATGVRSSDVVNSWYRNVAQKPMWWWSDFLLTQQFLEHQEKGSSMGLAAKQSHQFISDYRVPTATLPGVLPDRVGRFLAQSMADPSVTMFGRYRYGLYRSIANTASNLVGPNATKAERVQAVGNLLAMSALGTVVWPIINYGLRKVTGNKDAELSPAGVLREGSTLYHAAGAAATKDLGDVVRNVMQPAPLITAGSELSSNKDWKGHNIVERGQTFTPRGAGQLGEWAAHQVSPYSNVVEGMQGAQTTAGGVGRIIAKQAGVSLPSEKSQLYTAKIIKENAEAARQRARKPGGPIEQGVNALTR